MEPNPCDHNLLPSYDDVDTNLELKLPYELARTSHEPARDRDENNLRHSQDLQYLAAGQSTSSLGDVGQYNLKKLVDLRETSQMPLNLDFNLPASSDDLDTNLELAQPNELPRTSHEPARDQQARVLVVAVAEKSIVDKDVLAGKAVICTKIKGHNLCHRKDLQYLAAQYAWKKLLKRQNVDTFSAEDVFLVQCLLRAKCSTCRKLKAKYTFRIYFPRSD
ncbi:Uncharacterized protein Fot_53030 [Forsythia ovata]|uniref:Uncharacterized protein n=1 Tax=Forsythia ovata TaxID=205694 RepID=A0ABD1PK58_9LAMI